MIIWRTGLAGVKGAAKRLIKGFINPQYTAPSEVIVPPVVETQPPSTQRTSVFSSTQRSSKMTNVNRSTILTRKNRRLT